MGHQAKLKKNKLQLQSEIKSPSTLNPQQFVEELENQGFTLEKIVRSPQLPEDKREPQI